MKKIILSLLLFFVSSTAFWANVEDVFNDVSKDYKYYNELQFLYDRWIFSPDENWNLSPYSLLTRAEFVAVTMEVSCNKCMPPNVPFDLINKYDSEPFFDVKKSDDFFYCIADAKEKNVVRWYSDWYLCEDWTYSENQTPFCQENFVTREEAIAVLLRNSAIFSIEDNKEITDLIFKWSISVPLAVDVLPLENGYPYGFYGYFKKALEYEYNDTLVSSDWNFIDKKYSIIELDWNDRLYPRKSLTKEEFIKMAYILFKTNSCNYDKWWDNWWNSGDNWQVWWWDLDFGYSDYNQDFKTWLWVSVDIFSGDCDSASNCVPLEVFDMKSYDFSSNVTWVCNLWIDDEDYIWEIYTKKSDNYQKIYRWNYIDNFDFKDLDWDIIYWNFIITLKVKDNCWNSWFYSFSLFNQENKPLYYLKIDANPNIWYAPLFVDFKWDSNLANYAWDFWDETFWVWKKQNHIYNINWGYIVFLTSVAPSWEILKSATWINALKKNKNPVFIIANPTSWNAPLFVDFGSIWCPYDPIWEFWDWNDYSWKKTSYTYSSPWNYEVILTCNYPDWESVSDTMEIVVWNWDFEENWDDFYIIYEETSPWNFDFTVIWGNVDWDFSWSFGDWETWNWQPVEHSYDSNWRYRIDLTYKDKDWNIYKDFIFVDVVLFDEDDLGLKDTDWDGISDDKDLCVFVFWDFENSGCPLFEEFCDNNSDCISWICSSSWKCVWDADWDWVYDDVDECRVVYWDLENWCPSRNVCWVNIYNSGVVWTSFCNSCPCSTFVDFSSTIATCDIVFPAILSPDWKTIYSKWENFLIEENTEK